RNINNLCDNVLLNGFAAGEAIISRAAVQEVAETFDVLPRVQNLEEREAPARVFHAAGRAELWAAGEGNGNGHRNGNGNGSAGKSADLRSMNSVPRTLTAPDPDIVFNEHPRLSESPTTIEDLGAAFSRSGLGRGNNG